MAAQFTPIQRRFFYTLALGFVSSLWVSLAQVGQPFNGPVRSFGESGGNGDCALCNRGAQEVFEGIPLAFHASSVPLNENLMTHLNAEFPTGTGTVSRGFFKDPASDWMRNMNLMQGSGFMRDPFLANLSAIGNGRTSIFDGVSFDNNAIMPYQYMALSHQLPSDGINTATALAVQTFYNINMPAYSFLNPPLYRYTIPLPQGPAF